MFNQNIVREYDMEVYLEPIGELDNCVYTKPMELFRSKQLVKACAPMVRYSKLPFRLLVRKYGCNLAYTPMIVCSSFISSYKARDVEFTTSAKDRPLIVQFAANNGTDIAEAAEIVYSYSDGVDINCGCPQKWALSEGYGASLIDEPNLVRDMVLQTRNRIPDADFTVSIKIRIHNDIKKTVEFCRRAERAGVSWITVHGRTHCQRKEPVSTESIKTIKESLQIPVIGNGDVFSLNDAQKMHQETGVDGIMAARGILQNPGLFSGTTFTTVDCLKDWMNLSLSHGVSYTTFHHHFMFMLEKVMPRAERKFFNTLTSVSSVLDHLQSYIM